MSKTVSITSPILESREKSTIMVLVDSIKYLAISNIIAHLQKILVTAGKGAKAFISAFKYINERKNQKS